MTHKIFNILCLGLYAAFSTAQVSSALDSAKLQQLLSSTDRDVSDFMRDPVRKPVEVLSFAGIDEGMTVLDLYAAGGYYTFILAKAVGDTGTVYAQNTERGLRFIEDRQNRTQGEALTEKIDRGDLTNVTQLIGPLNSLSLAENSLDAVMLAQTLHDSYNPNPERALNLLLQLKSLLKSGGFVVLTDHVGVSGRDNREMHRMEIEQAIAVAEQAGFAVETSELLRNPEDDHRRSIFDPRLARNTDRFLLKLTKP
jgi:predicted methyltransferase